MGLSTEKNKRYIALQYVRGMTLQQIIENNLARGEAFCIALADSAAWQNRCFRWFRQLISAIQTLHSLEIMHRDINPRNIIIKRDDTLVLVDLATSKPFNGYTKTMLFSHMFQPPELYWILHGGGDINGLRYGLFYDIYCAGVVTLMAYNLKLYSGEGQIPGTGELLVNNLPYARHQCADSPDNIRDILHVIFEDRTSPEQGITAQAIMDMLNDVN
jgi:serine/threonine protein kinase